MKEERDLDIKNIFTKHNLGPVPESPFTNDVAIDLTNRIKARLSNLENDLQEKKVFSLLFGIASDVYFYQTILKMKFFIELSTLHTCFILHPSRLQFSSLFLLSSQWLDAQFMCEVIFNEEGCYFISLKASVPVHAGFIIKKYLLIMVVLFP